MGDRPGHLIASAVTPSGGRGRRTDGGYWVEGTWRFSSGSDVCQWVILGTPIFEPESGPPREQRP